MASLKLILSIIATLWAFTTVLAHPGEHHDQAEITHEIAKRNAHGASNPGFRALRARGETRRYEKAKAMRKARNLAVDSKKPSEGWKQLIDHKQSPTRLVVI